MANVKNRAKSKPNRSKTKPTSTGVSEKSIMIEKKHELSLQLTSMDKVVMLLQNGHLMKDKFPKPILPTVNETLEKSKLPIHRESIISKSGEIKTKSNKALMFIDGLLKQELLIESKKKKSKEKKTKVYNGINNNVYEKSDSNVEDEVSPRSSTSSHNSLDIINDKSTLKGKNNLNILNSVTGSSQNEAVTLKISGKNNLAAKRKRNLIQSSKDSTLTQDDMLSSSNAPNINPAEPDECPNKRKRYLPNRIPIKNKLNTQINTISSENSETLTGTLNKHLKRKLNQSKATKNEVLTESKTDLQWRPVIRTDLFSKPKTRGEKLARLTELASKTEDQTKLTNTTIPQQDFLIKIKYQNPTLSQSGPKTKDTTVPGKKKSKPKKTPAEIKKKPTKSGSNKIAKPKQVKLSNGVVLTLTLFQCDYCEKVFTNKSSLRRHIYQHLGLKPYRCERCRKRFQQRISLKKHVLNKHSVKEPEPECYTCVECNKPFLLLENLCLHLTSHVKTESVQCLYCEKKFSHNILLAQHEKQHLVAGRFQCSICSMSYDCRSRLALHVKSHLNIKDYVCQYCGKEFLRANSIRRHVEICHGGFRVECPICNKKLRGHLAEHLRLHEKKRPHACPECGLTFTQSTQLRVHRRSHSGARPYSCRICKTAFGHSNALSMHIRRHTGEKPFPCALCPMSFSQLPHMKTHMKRIHGKDDSYKCERCDEWFKLKSQLDNHMKLCSIVVPPPLSLEEQIQASIQPELPPVESPMNISRMRFLLALLLTMIASKEKLKYLGFNKRLIDDLLIDSLEAMGHRPCKDKTLTPLKKLKTNIEILLKGTVPSDQLDKFRQENRSTEEILDLLTKEEK